MTRMPPALRARHDRAIERATRRPTLQRSLASSSTTFDTSASRLGMAKRKSSDDDEQDPGTPSKRRRGGVADLLEDEIKHEDQPDTKIKLEQTTSPRSSPCPSLPPKIATVPPEILLLIMSHLKTGGAWVNDTPENRPLPYLHQLKSDREALLNAALTSRLFYASAMPILYEEVFLTSPGELVNSFETVIYFLRTLLSWGPGRRKWVRRLRCDVIFNLDHNAYESLLLEHGGLSPVNERSFRGEWSARWRDLAMPLRLPEIGAACTREEFKALDRIVKLCRLDPRPVRSKSAAAKAGRLVNTPYGEQMLAAILLLLPSLRECQLASPQPSMDNGGSRKLYEMECHSLEYFDATKMVMDGCLDEIKQDDKCTLLQKLESVTVYRHPRSHLASSKPQTVPGLSRVFLAAASELRCLTIANARFFGGHWSGSLRGACAKLRELRLLRVDERALGCFPAAILESLGRMQRLALTFVDDGNKPPVKATTATDEDDYEEESPLAPACWNGTISGLLGKCSDEALTHLELRAGMICKGAPESRPGSDTRIPLAISRLSGLRFLHVDACWLLGDVDLFATPFLRRRISTALPPRLETLVIEEVWHNVGADPLGGASKTRQPVDIAAYRGNFYGALRDLAADCEDDVPCLRRLVVRHFSNLTGVAMRETPDFGVLVDLFKRQGVELRFVRGRLYEIGQPLVEGRGWAAS